MSESVKYDSDKLRWDLLPIECVEDVVKILTFGAKKYAPNNWQKLPDAEERYYAAAMRHLAAWRMGEKNDTESGLPHLSHLMCCITFLLWFEKQKNIHQKAIRSVPEYRLEYINLGTTCQPQVETGTSVSTVEKEN